MCVSATHGEHSLNNRPRSLRMPVSDGTFVASGGAIPIALMLGLIAVAAIY